MKSSWKTVSNTIIGCFDNIECTKKISYNYNEFFILLKNNKVSFPIFSFILLRNTKDKDSDTTAMVTGVLENKIKVRISSRMIKTKYNKVILIGKLA